MLHSFMFFSTGPAENVLPGLLKKNPGKKTVAIVDPPRAGLHPRAVSALRSSGVQSFVYISCDANAAMKNFVAFGRPTSRAFPGDPFIPRRAIPVDLFPHANHFELILLFERLPLMEIIDKQVGDKTGDDDEVKGVKEDKEGDSVMS